MGKIRYPKFAILGRAPIFAHIINQKPSTMKKFLAVIVIAGALVACNNSGESTTTTDSPATTTDTSNMNTMNTMPDTTHMAGDTSKMMGDTTHK